jgi:hypothetical protein
MTKVTDAQLVYNNKVHSTNFQEHISRELIPYFSLYSDRLVLHPETFKRLFSTKVKDSSLANLKKEKFQGNISHSQQSVIKKKLTAWITSIIEQNKATRYSYKRKEHYPVFITVTLASEQVHPDKEIKRKLLDLFIKRIKKEFGIEKYFWRAEKQENGNIHFHIVADKYCRYIKLLEIWNKVQENLGYITEFQKRYPHQTPAGVNVKGIKDVKNFVNYVIKYCAKNSQVKAVQGRVYGMSDNLREITVYKDVLDSELNAGINKSIENQDFKVYYGEYFSVFLFNKSFYETEFYKVLQSRSKSYYLDLYKYLYFAPKQDVPIYKEVQKVNSIDHKQGVLFEESEVCRQPASWYDF